MPRNPHPTHPLPILAALLLSALPATLCAASLREAVHQALALHPEVAAAEHERTATAEELARARSAYRPQLDASAEYGRERGDSDAGGRRDASPSRRLALTLNQALYDPAKRREIERQRARLDAAGEALRSRREAVTLAAVERYLEVWRAERVVRLSAEQIERHRATLAKVEGRLAAGEGGLGDVKQAESRLTEARATAVDNLRTLEQERAGYRRVVGEAPGELSRPRLPAEALPTTLEDALSRSLDNSPEMARANAEISAAEAALGVAEAGFLPTLGAELSADESDNAGGVSGNDEELRAMVVLRYNLYAGGADRARKGEAAARRLVAIDQRDALRRQLEEQTRRAWIAIGRSDEKLALLEHQQATAEEVVEIYRKEFEIGQHSLLDLLDSESERFTARVRRIAAGKEALLARYQLLAAMGELTESVERIPDTPAQPPTPPAQPATEAPPQAVPTPPPGEAAWVVLPAADRAAAEALGTELGARGYGHFIARLDDGRPAVSLGVFRDPANAEQLRDELRRLGYRPELHTRRLP
ncbi:TolC family outer membrane protein [Endothiovibrio diazotrophicus]